MLPSERPEYIWSVLLVDDLVSAAAIQAELQPRGHVVGVEFAARRHVSSIQVHR